MIKLGPRHNLVERVEDLPAPRPGRLFKDAETRIRFDDPSEWNNGGLYPYLGDRAAMWSVCFDDDGPAWSVPLRMRFSPNLPIESVVRWQRDLLAVATSWCNHNVKFDAHFAAADGVLFPESCELEDTLTLAKLLDSDRYQHGLKPLSRDWLNYDTGGADRVRAFLDGFKLPRNKKCNDYAVVPSDILGFYACDDVLSTRELFRYCIKNLPEQVGPTWDMERKLTPVLWDMEYLGIRTDAMELKKAKLTSLIKQVKLATLVNELSGAEWADSAQFMFSLIVGKWGMPILSRNKETGNPSFDYHALLTYLQHPDIVLDPIKTQTLQAIMALRDEETFSSLFVDVFLEHADSKGFVHPTYNQLIRTGRMSCEKPNAQQFNAQAKHLCLTDAPELAFMDSDASQIEFRWIVHYIKDEEAIAAYQRDPKMDFHQWVADLIGIPRKPAKNFNFAQGYGAGERKIVTMLRGTPEIINAVTESLNKEHIPPEEWREKFELSLTNQAKNIFNTYHERLPGIKKTSRYAAQVCAARGFIFNFYGRRRHLPAKAAHRAFNTLCQGGAMDMIKRRMIATSQRYNSDLRCDGITLRANVHDALLHHGHPDALRLHQPKILELLQYAEPGFRVPIYWESDIKVGRWEPTPT